MYQVFFKIEVNLKIDAKDEAEANSIANGMSSLELLKKAGRKIIIEIEDVVK